MLDVYGGDPARADLRTLRAGRPAMSAVEDNAGELARLLVIAEVLIMHPDVDQPVMISGGNVAVVSSPAWNTPAAYAITDAHAGVRQAENDLRAQVTGSQLQRGGSDGNTRAALKAIIVLAAALDDQHQPSLKRKCRCSPCRVARALAGWASQIRVLAAVGEAVRWEQIRGEDGKAKACPYCDTPSLRMAVGEYKVACGNPECEDDNGEPPVAVMEIGVTGEGILAWADGRVT